MIIATATAVTVAGFMVNPTVLAVSGPPVLGATRDPPLTVSVSVSAFVSFTDIDCEPVFGPVVNELGERVVFVETP